MIKKLYKSEEDRKIAGVCGGIAEYFNIDSTLIRLGFILFGLCAGGGIITYIIAAIIMPDKPKKTIIEDNSKANKKK